MPYIKHVGATSTADANNVTVTLPAGKYAVGDLLLICLTNQSTGAFTANTSGWTLIGTAAANVSRQQWAWKIAASTSETNPNFSGSNDAWICSPYVIADAHPSSPIANWQRKSWGTAYSADSNTSVLASSNANAVIQPAGSSLLFYSWGGSDGQLMRGTGDTLLGNAVAYRSLGTNSVSHCVGYRNPNSSGDAPNCSMNTLSNVMSGNCWVIEVANATNGNREQQTFVIDSTISLYGNFGDVLSAFGTVGAPNTIASSINGITCSSTASAKSNSPTPFSGTAWGEATALSSTEITAGAWVGGVQTLGAAINLSDKVFNLRTRQNNNSGSNAGAEGQLQVFVDGSGNWAAYQIVPQTLTALTGLSTEVNVFIKCGEAVEYATSGTIDWTNITKLGFLSHRVGSQSNDGTIYLKDGFILGTAVITGGGSGRPANFSTAALQVNAWYQTRLIDLQASSQVQIKTDVQIGNGTSYTYFKASAQSAEYPVAFDFSSIVPPKYAWNGDASVMNLTVYASASDTIDFSAALLSSEQLQNFTIHASSSTSASYVFTGASFVGWNTTWKTGVPCSGITFQRCSKLALKGATAENITISDPVATDAAVSFDTSGGSLTDSTIDITGRTLDYHLELAAACTAITLDNLTFVGTPTVDKVHVKATTGTVTITIAGSTSLAAGDITSDGATVVLVSPTANITISNSNLINGSKVLLRNITKGTELDITTVVGGAGYSFNTDVGASEAVSVGDTIRIYATYANGTSYKENYTEAAVATLSDMEFIGSQTDWTDANNLATDGSAQTEFTADYPNIQVDINSPDNYWQGAKLVAWFLYNQTTDDGIRNYFGAIESNGAVWTILTATADVYLDNLGASSISQNDNIYVQRDDGAYPQYNPTTGGGGIGMKQTGEVFVVTVAGASVITGTVTQVLDAIAEIPDPLTLPQFVALK